MVGGRPDVASLFSGHMVALAMVCRFFAEQTNADLQSLVTRLDRNVADLRQGGENEGAFDPLGNAGRRAAG